LISCSLPSCLSHKVLPIILIAFDLTIFIPSARCLVHPCCHLETKSSNEAPHQDKLGKVYKYNPCFVLNCIGAAFVDNNFSRTEHRSVIFGLQSEMTKGLIDGRKYSDLNSLRQRTLHNLLALSISFRLPRSDRRQNSDR
jgi:hypothetical protein